tara:strand:+ start:159 stop:305 length:147 start_codon:yes stop_codon:yes gene_type:complete
VSVCHVKRGTEAIEKEEHKAVRKAVVEGPDAKDDARIPYSQGMRKEMG